MGNPFRSMWNAILDGPINGSTRLHWRPETAISARRQPSNWNGLHLLAVIRLGWNKFYDCIHSDCSMRQMQKTSYINSQNNTDKIHTKIIPQQAKCKKCKESKIHLNQHMHKLMFMFTLYSKNTSNNILSYPL